ncbi:MAG TPA: TOMM precursor leader peptide-binding protein [Longimicrobiales bacterium]|nr:TOMM precursor leader peptide-binding protein [Longimicrobiales bacterium]
MFLLTDRASIVLEGRLVCAVARALEAPRTVRDLCGHLADYFDPLEVRYGLSILQGRGCVLDAGDVPAWRLPGSRDLPWAPPDRRSDLGRRTSPPPVPELTDDYFDVEFGRRLRAHRAAGRAVLPLKISGPELWMGPVLSGDGPGCGRCLQLRLSMALRVHAFVHRSGVPLRPAPRLGSVEEALELAREGARTWGDMAGGHPLDGHLWSWNADTGASAVHGFRPLPGCPGCGAGSPTPDASPPARPEESAIAGEEGMISPEERLESLEALVDPLLGVIPRLDRIPVPGAPLHLWVTPSPAARMRRDWEGTRDALSHGCVGKAATEPQARLGALAEAVERYSGLRLGGESTIRGSLKSLGDAALHPNDCLLFSDAQYRERVSWNERTAAVNWVPEPFDLHADLDWTPLRSLTHGRTRYLPSEYLFYSMGPTAGLRADSNGCAAGASIEDATLRAFLELVERDAVAIWWYNELQRPPVDVASFGDPFCQEVVAWIGSSGRTVVVFDLTHDLGIPVLAAVSHGSVGDASEVALGFGAHLDPDRALRRALLELGQGFAARGARSDAPDLFDVARLDARFLIPTPGAECRALGDMAAPPRGSVRACLEWCVERTREAGLELLLLDQTRADTGLPVVRAVVPGLRSQWARFAPGRLFRVPTRLGWCVEPRSEGSLNPSHLYL